MNQETIASLQKKIDKYTKKTKGISVVLTSNKETVFEYCTGVIDEKETPNDSTKMMSIGSNTKLLTAIAIFQQIDHGKLDLDKDITTYIPEFEIQSHFEYDKITTRQLLMHRSGLPGDDYRLFFDEKLTQRDDLLPKLKENYLCTTPGTMYAYSNLAYGLLGLIIERLSGQSFIEYVEEHIFTPLQLSMKILPTVSDKDQFRGIISEGFDKKKKVKKYDLTTLISAGSSTYATITDMAVFLRFFLNPENQTILSKASMEQLLAPPPEGMYTNHEAGHGLGMVHNAYNYLVDDVGSSIGHGGATMYHFSVFQMLPKQQVGIAVMSNTTGTNPIIDKVARDILYEYLSSINIPLEPISIPESPPVTTNLDSMTGDFINVGLKIPIYLAKDGSLRIKISFMKAKLTLREDGNMSATPIGVAKLPFFKKTFTNKLLHISETKQKRILYFKVHRKYTVQNGAVAEEYRPVPNIEKYRYLVGKYNRVTSIKHFDKFAKKAVVKMKNNELSVTTLLEGTKMTFRLYPINETLFILQGYGRYSYGAVEIDSSTDKPTITFMGIKVQKA